MTTNQILFKAEDSFIKELDKAVKANNYQSRTELIREAIRDKLTELSRDELAKEFVRKFYEKGTKHSDNEWKAMHEKAGKEYLAELEKRFR